MVIVVPVFGRHDLTDQLLIDLGSESRNVVVIDNSGDYVPIADVLRVEVPGVNLGWAAGCNMGLGLARRFRARHCLLLNNDVRLSAGFVAGLVEASESGAAIIGPLYDHNWPHQRGSYGGPAANYSPRAIERAVPFIDGTAMLITGRWLAHDLDSVSWPRFGWGCDKDLCLRVRASGGDIVVTERSYLNHLGRGTAALDPQFSEAAAEVENDEGMSRKYGPGWRDLLYDGFQALGRQGDTQDRLTRSP